MEQHVLQPSPLPPHRRHGFFTCVVPPQFIKAFMSARGVKTQPANTPAPAQKVPAVFCPAIVTKTATDEFTVKAGKPVTRITPEQLASRFNVDRDSVYRWRQDGTIPEKFVSLGGKRKLMFSADVIEFLEAHFSELRQ